MSRPQPLSLRLVRLAAGIAVALPAISLYGAAGAWADKPTPSSTVTADTHGDDKARGGDGEHGHDAASGPGASDSAAGGSAGSIAVVAAASSEHDSAQGDNGKGKDGKGSDGEHGNSKKDGDSGPATTSAAVTSASGSSDHSKGNASTVGSVKSPQPLSNADKNPGGANNGGNCGSYCSTRDGSPSLNGNGGGEAKGKPCAGCVGKADNKNPPGQYKDGSDHNNGYECDGNHGIGRSNPAHTGCSPRPTPSSSPSCAKKDSCHHEDCDSDKHGKDHKGHKGNGGTPCPTHSPTPSPTPTCHVTGGCGGNTTGTTTGNTTGTTTGGATTGGGSTGGGSTGNGTGGGSGGATTGFGGGASGGAQGTTGGTKPPTCPSLTAGGMTGPVRAGCPIGGGGGGAAEQPALPFTGTDLSVLIGIASLAGGLGLALTTAGNLRRQPQD